MPGNVGAVRERVQKILTRLIGRIEVTEDNEFSFPHESTRVFVRVDPWKETSTIVTIYAYTNVDVPSSPELFQYLATDNTWLFGHLSAREDEGTVLVTFSHALLGDFLDQDELRTAVIAVAFAADEIDDKIMAQFGGSRMADL